MLTDDERRPDPDALLQSLRQEDTSGKPRGRLKIFLGYAAGVGKTYAMLDEAHSMQRAGVDVVVGYVEPHTRPETLRLLEGLPAIAPFSVRYKNIVVQEFDLEAALRRKPSLLLVDELAHTNAEGMRNRKRYQDIEELLNAGIDVYTTVNVQHLESLNDVVEDITKIAVRETVPDSVFDRADAVKLIDIDPDELLQRFSEGKIYRPDRAALATQNFFTRENLRLLREIALRKAAERIGQENRHENAHTSRTASQRFLVCISPSPSASKCIRWAARTADAFHASWSALYVETSRSERMTEEQRRRLRAHLDLASRLGGQIVTLTGEDVAATIAEYARLSGITNIVIGKTRRSHSLRRLFEQDIEDQLIAMLAHTEIHIIPDRDNARVSRIRLLRRMHLPGALHFSLADTVKSLLILTAATLCSFLLRALGIGDQNIIMLFILAVLVISRLTAGYVYGVFSSVVSVLVFNFFFVEPYYTFTAIQPGYPITFLIMLFAALFTSALMVRIKTQARLSVEREHRTEMLYEINKKLLSTRGLENIVQLSNGYIARLLERPCVFYTEDPANGKAGTVRAVAGADASFLNEPDEQAVAHWVFLNRKRAGAGTDTLMGAGAYYMPVLSQNGVLAVLGISCKGGRSLDHNNRVYLRMIASLVALALERQRLSDEQNRILIESEKESMRSNLLRAISHDLRTPLTAISGASSALLETGDSMDPSTCARLITDIHDDALWLSRMVENLLSVTRISGGAAQLKKTAEAVEEVVSEAVQRVKSKYPDARISVRVPDALLLVSMDATLIEQVLINLLENAIRHNRQDVCIDLAVHTENDTAVFEVADNGRGLEPGNPEALFDGFRQDERPVDASRGIGIGLSICRSIIRAHGGEISAKNREGGGAAFRFSLPMKEDAANGE